MIAAVVLAAGGSRRLGAPKALFRVDGRSLVRRAAEAALRGGCAPVVVVVGDQATAIRRELDPLAVEIVANAGWREGLGSSIRAGVAEISGRCGQARAVLLLTIDQALLDERAVRGLCERFDGSASALVASRYAGTLGVPALFGREYFPDLARLAGDRGAKSLLLERLDRVRVVDWPDGAVDLDTPADAARLEEGLRRPSGDD